MCASGSPSAARWPLICWSPPSTRRSVVLGLPGSAARALRRHLGRAGVRSVVATANFYVTGRSGPLADGELERARSWGRHLVRKANLVATDAESAEAEELAAHEPRRARAGSPRSRPALGHKWTERPAKLFQLDAETCRTVLAVHEVGRLVLPGRDPYIVP